jgi:hypothetical protein
MEMNLKFDPGKPGLSKVFRDYQIEALRFLWDVEGGGAVSREVWASVNEALGEGKSISRASIINFLNSMVDEGVLGYTERSGKVGYHRVYSPKMGEEEFARFLVENLLSSLMRDFPEETREVIDELKD